MVWVIKMDIMQLNGLFSSDFNLDNITSVRQNWNAETRYNRMEIPRHRNALLLLTDYPAVFQFSDNHTLRAKVGDIVLLPKGARYMLRFLVPEGHHTHPIVVNFRLTDTDGNELEVDTGVIRLCTDDGTFAVLFQSSAQLYRSASPVLLKAKIYELFGNLFPISERDECCIGYINQHYTEKFSIPNLAQRCALSEGAYRKRFKMITGLSPIQYINKLKIEKACQLILTGDISMQEISDFLNFYNLPYFYKIFKDYMGITPIQYREQMGDNPASDT